MQQRIAAVQQMRASKHAARIAARKHDAFITGVHQLAAQLGVDPAQLLRAQKVAYNARANSATVAPSSEVVHVNGEALRPCKAVHALCATIPNATRSEMLQLCKDNGINPSTAATQVGKFRAMQAEAAKTAN
jgi:prolyl-tRNA editing enzyme YbaK/EbsC (Cys-tRNA(Pro) deacylase)